MSLTFIHSADWQIGKPFAGVEDAEKRARLRQERLAAIDRIGEIARERGAAFILVAGDLFDAPTVSRATVSQACGAIGRLGLPVYVIPGNHDHGGPGCLWEQAFFKQEQAALAPNLRLLLAPEPVDADGAVLFPCPLLRRHEPTDPTAWLRTFTEADLARYGDKPRLVLAHGGIHGFEGGDDENEAAGPANLIQIDRLPPGVFDYLALGDWHGTKQAAPAAWYAGTPEPDRFPKGAANAPGHVLAVTAGRGLAPAVVPVPTARLGWHTMDFTFYAEGDLEVLEDRLRQILGNRTGEDLLRLSLQGSLGIAASARLETCLAAWEARLLRLKLDDRTVLAPGAAEIEALANRAGDPLISRVAGQLIESARGESDEAAIARAALRELHAFLESTG